MRLRPFRALRPAPAVAARVASPPYDVVTRSEAVALAAGNPLSFLHVGRAEIDLPEDIDPHDARVYARARENLEGLARDGALQRDSKAALFLYRETTGGRSQLGVVGCVSVDDYERDVIRKHERTRPDKEDDRTRHMLALGAHAEPVLIAYRGRPAIDQLAAAAIAGPPLVDFTTGDGVRHTVWQAPDSEALAEAFSAVPRAYVADGHHRSASAARAARERRGRGVTDARDWFPAALVPADQLAILAYNRVVRDLGGLATGDVLERLRRVGRLGPASDPAPSRPGIVALYLDGRWHSLELPPEPMPRDDPVRSLDVWRLQERVLVPVLGIGDQRTDPRIDFVGGVRGHRELEARVDSGAAALGIALFPTTVEQLMAVADAGAVMPPKSTWFEPKLLSGLFVHTFDDN